MLSAPPQRPSRARLVVPAAAALASLLSPCSAFAQAGAAPNVLHVFADDLAFGSVGFQNASTYIRTPNLDRLAAGGMILDRSYASTVCSPSRGSLLTGFHNGHAYNDRNQDTGRGLRAQDVTTGEVLQEAGYRTALHGKWGWGATGRDREIGRDADPVPRLQSDRAGDLPNRQGFDEFSGYLSHEAAHDHYYDWGWESTDGRDPVLVRNVGADGRPEYFQDAYNRRSEAFIRERAVDDQPFYLQVSYTAPHFDIDAVATADPLRDLDGRTVDHADFGFYEGVATLDDKQRKYAANISRVDASIGTLLARLEDPDGNGDTSDSILRDTLVLFTSDNGATPEDGSPARDLAVNGGLRGGKRDLYEGGIRMPAFAYWDGTIEAGTRTDLLNELSDFQSTAAQLAGTRARVGVDGVSLLPTLDPDGGWGLQRDREFLVFENFAPSYLGEPRTAQTLIRGDDKLVVRADGQLELYDLGADPRETRPLDLGANAALVGELSAILQAEIVSSDNDYAVEMREWIGADGDSINAASWAVTDEPGSVAGTPEATWSARVRNTGSTAALAVVGVSTPTLGLEVSGVDARQTVRVDSGATLSGRNEVRVGDNGTLVLEGSTVASRRWVDVLAGGELLGTGTVDSTLYNAGRLSAGPVGPAGAVTPAASGSIGRLNVEGDLLHLEGGTLVIDLQSGGVGDLLAVAGAAVLEGDVEFRTGGREPLKLGESFAFLTALGVTGSFGRVVGTDLGGGLSLEVRYTGDSVVATVVPEPVCLLPALGALTLLRRRRSGGERSA